MNNFKGVQKELKNMESLFQSCIIWNNLTYQHHTSLIWLH